jgi:hypothetical protein
VGSAGRQGGLSKLAGRAVQAGMAGQSSQVSRPEHTAMQAEQSRQPGRQTWQIRKEGRLAGQRTECNAGRKLGRQRRQAYTARRQPEKSKQAGQSREAGLSRQIRQVSHAGSQGSSGCEAGMEGR